MLPSAGHSMCYSISRQGAAMAGGRFPQQVNMAIDEITYMHQRDFHGGVFPLRLYRHSWLDLQDTDVIQGPAENLAAFTLCAKIYFGWSDHKGIVETYRDLVIRTTFRQVWEMNVNGLDTADLPVLNSPVKSPKARSFCSAAATLSYRKQMWSNNLIPIDYFWHIVAPDARRLWIYLNYLFCVFLSV